MYKIHDSINFRMNIRQKISDVINIDDSIVSSNIEIGIFNYAIEESNHKNIIKKWDNPIFVQLYIDRLRSVMINLKNTDIIQRIKLNIIKPQDVAFMSHQEYNPENWKERIEQKQKRDASKLNDNIEASTDVYVCRKCKSRKCTYEAVQIRASDEPMTIFVTCLNCGKNWKC